MLALMTTDQLLTPQELADLAQVPLSTVYRWNHNRSGPRVIHVGKHARYRRVDVEAWLERQAQPRSA